MAQLIADRKDIDFVLYKQLKIDELVKYPKYSAFNKKTFDMIISEARNFAFKEILPTFTEGDREGVLYQDGKVKVPQCYHRPYKLLSEGGWVAMTEKSELGGQDLPHVVAKAAEEYYIGANKSFTTYARLGRGTAKSIELFGTEKLKKLFVKKIYTAEWTATMVLTESCAGSDVGALETEAVKNEDGTYSICGNKTFITCGDHDLTGNIIHAVLARIEGAPKGTKGISLFIVPKIWVNDDGSLGELNDVVCTGIEEKMGIHGSATCSLSFGSKGKCRGFLLGEKNKGMKLMFHMMNEARLGVGSLGLMQASAAYLYALNYARERIQGRAIENVMNPEAPLVSIIEHPDVRRMLLWMKAHVDGMRSFVYYIAYLFDMQKCTEDIDKQEQFKELIDLLTPVIKAYNTDRGFEVCVQALQVYGGYGYIKDYPVEQILRDCKIDSIYEGTNGIQAMDLVGRKIGMKRGAVFENFLSEVLHIVSMAKKIDKTDWMAEKLEQTTLKLKEVAILLQQKMMSVEFKTAFGHASLFLEIMGDYIIAWMLLWRTAISLELLKGSSKESEMHFYEGQYITTKYYFRNVLPIVIGKMNVIMESDRSVIDMEESFFSGR